MTALIYKAALPTYTSLAELNANAGESLLLNDAGTAYELEPAQSGASVPEGITLTGGDDPRTIAVEPEIGQTEPLLIFTDSAGRTCIVTSTSWPSSCEPRLIARYQVARGYGR